MFKRFFSIDKRGVRTKSANDRIINQHDVSNTDLHQALSSKYYLLSSLLFYRETDASRALNLTVKG